MRLGFHGAPSMTSNLETDVQATAHAGFKALELWAGKIDKYLEDHSLEDFKTLLVDNGVAAMSINSIEFITFRGDEYPKIRARCRDLCQMAQAIDCPTIIVVPSPTPSYQTTWLDDICQRLKNAGYDGDCSVELFRPEYWEWDPNELAVQARNSAMNVLSPYFDVE